MKTSPPLLYALAVATALLLPPVSALADDQQASPPPTAPGTGRTQPVAPAPDPTSEMATLLKRGATMEEIAKLRDPVANSPAEAINALKTGNARFFGGTARRPELSANERRSQILSQTPFAVVVGCSDSRVPTEIVYDQGLGSLFTIRIAGNISEPAVLGSIEYAVEHLKSKLVVVMGHEGCGAVAAAMLPAEKRAAEPENVRFLMDRIVPAVKDIPKLRDPKARMREAVVSNVRLQVAAMRKNPVIVEAEKAGHIRVIGAYYEITSGAVDFLEKDEDLRVSLGGQDFERTRRGLERYAENYRRDQQRADRALAANSLP